MATDEYGREGGMAWCCKQVGGCLQGTGYQVIGLLKILCVRMISLYNYLLMLLYYSIAEINNILLKLFWILLLPFFAGSSGFSQMVALVGLRGKVVEAFNQQIWHLQKRKKLFFNIMILVLLNLKMATSELALTTQVQEFSCLRGRKRELEEGATRGHRSTTDPP